MDMELKRAEGLKGELTVPPDKSISHRAVMFGSIAEGESVVRNFLRAEDPISTMNAFKSMGIEIEQKSSRPADRQPKEKDTTALLRYSTADLIIHGKGLRGLKEPFDVINCGNSGTTARLISGILAGSRFFSVLTGDDSLKQRPMSRVIEPLKKMGADISGRDGDGYLPLAVKGAPLKAVDYNIQVASAQVKSCIILAGLYAEGATTVNEPHKSRDHTERMLKAMGAGITVEDLKIRINGGSALNPFDITIPADFSSAAFFIAAALIVPGSEVLIKGVGVNPTRTGLLNVIRDMGAPVELNDMREVSGEPVADIYCKYAQQLKAVKIGRESIPALIDEFPVLCVLASQADGITEIRGAEELRVKESDRIKAMSSELQKLGVELEEFPDGIAIKGKTRLKGAAVESHGDHRIAMSLSIASLAAEGRTVIAGASCVDISFPGFFEKLSELSR